MKLTALFLSLLIGLSARTFGQEPKPTIDWQLNRLDEIAGHKSTLLGSPRQIDTPAGQAVEFDGHSAIFLETNSLAGLDAFTTEVIFRPAAGGEKEQRFLH